MFILNKKTKVIQECRNQDVIKMCKRDTKNYAVANTRAELETMSSQEPQKQPENTKAKENSTKEPKGAPEGKTESQAAADEAPKNADGQDTWKELQEEEKLAALEAKKVEELRKIAKAEGIQGYANMSKDTLVAMIMNH